jgi:hypothetical protein
LHKVSPSIILAHPLAWIDYIDEHRVTHSWSPNFGFKQVVNHMHKRKEKNERVAHREWDLSCLQFLMNAGEQVTAPVCEEFVECMMPYGLRGSAGIIFFPPLPPLFFLSFFLSFFSSVFSFLLSSSPPSLIFTSL